MHDSPRRGKLNNPKDIRLYDMSSSRRVKSAAAARNSEELGATEGSNPKNKGSDEAPASAKEVTSTEANLNASLEFSKDEQILCYHGPLLYEAKVLKAEFWNEEKLASLKQSSKKSQSKGKEKDPGEDLPGPRYQIHYKGWKQRWDEWVTSSRILKWTPSNLELQAKVNKKITVGKPRKVAAVAAVAAITAQSTSSPKSPTPSKPSPLPSRTARNSLKPETPQVVAPSPAVATPEITAPVSRPKRKIPEATGIRSKRLQAMRSQQAAAESPKNAAPEPEPVTRSRTNANKAPVNYTDSESLSETPSESEKLSSSTSDTPIAAPTPSATKAKPIPSEPQRNKRKVTKEEPPVQSNVVKQPITPIWDGPPRLELPIPDALKIHLIDQWDLISRCQELIPLPRKPSVRQILADYREHSVHALLAESSSASETPVADAPQELREGEVPSVLRTKIDVVNEVVDGIALYFSKALGSFLLYRFERPQHARILALYPKTRLYFQNGDSDSVQEEVDPIDPDSSAANLMKSPTAAEKDWDLLDIYGAEHLLRLFAYLPKLLSRSDLDAEGLNRIKVLLEDMLTYLSSRKTELFLDQFETAPPSYTKIVKLE